MESVFFVLNPEPDSELQRCSRGHFSDLVLVVISPISLSRSFHFFIYIFLGQFVAFLVPVINAF